MFAFDTIQILTAVAAFIRISSIVNFLPLFGENAVPLRVRVLLSVALTAGVLNVLPNDYSVAVAAAMKDVAALLFLVLREALVGVVIGYTAKLAFDGVVMAAGLVGVQMGFNTSDIFLPDSQEHGNSFSSLHRLLIALIFLTLSMHHMYIASIWESFHLIPIGKALPTSSLTHLLVTIIASVFVTALQLAAPILVGVLFATAALGLISRAVPQANVFVMSFPANFFVGLFIYMAMLPMLPGWIQNYFGKNEQQMVSTLAALVR